MAVICDPEGTSRYGEAARAALADTAAALNPTVCSVDDLSLCHGIAGLAETLRIGARLLHDEVLATSATTGAAVCANAWRTGPDALDDVIRRDPSLMVGVAGVLHTLLRAVAPDRVAPVLLGPTEP
jgi:lantibiotic modifying enzyme